MKAITKTIKLISYSSDDGKLISSNPAEIELYEAKQQEKQLPIENSFHFPDDDYEYRIYKINSKNDFLLYRASIDGYNLHIMGCQKSSDVGEIVKGYFVSHYYDCGDTEEYELYTLDNFTKMLKADLETIREELNEKEKALSILRSYGLYENKTDN